MKLFCLLTASLLCCAVVAQTKITPEDAGKYIGEKVTVHGKITGAVYKNSTKQTFLNMGPSAWNTTITVLINHADKKNFGYVPENFLVNKNTFVTGRVVDIAGSLSLVITKPDEIKVQQEDEDEIEIRPLAFDFFNKFFEED